MKNILNTIMIIILGALIFQCNNDDGCQFDNVTDTCEPYCEMYEDFEDQELGSNAGWFTIRGTVEVIDDGGNKVLFAEDGSGAQSFIYDSLRWPTNIFEQGCELRYDVKYELGSQNPGVTDNSIYFTDSSYPHTGITYAYFLLNASSAIPDDGNYHQIVVPLELATGTTLPSNSYGEWKLFGITTPTASDIAYFNNLLQNVQNVGFLLDEGSNPSENWYFDNFCFYQCCPDK